MDVFTCLLVSDFKKAPFAKMRLPAIPRVGETLIVKTHGSLEHRRYSVKAVGYAGNDHSHTAADDQSPVETMLLVHDL